MTQKKLIFLVKLLAVAAIYFAAAKFGLSLAFLNASVSPVWPPTGIAIAAVLIFGNRIWPGILLGAFLANFLTPVSVPIASVIALGNTVEAVACGSLLRALGFNNSFELAKDVFKFLVAVMLCTTLSATVGNVALSLGHDAPWQQFGQLWLTWWLGDTAGALTIGPLLLAWSVGPYHWLPKRRYLELVLVLLLLSVSSMATFSKPSPTPIQYFVLARFLVPFFLWAAFRLGRRGVTMATIVLSAFAVWGTANKLGPFANAPINDSLLLLQVFIGSNAVMFLFLVAVVEERRLSQESLRENERRLAGNLAITRILAESRTLDDATSRILRTIGETLHWDLGAMWTVDSSSNALRCLTIWRATSNAADKFDAISHERSFEPGAGLPGRVWTSLKPVWIPDVVEDESFPRASSAIAEGLHAAFAFPIIFGHEFLGVMEFFSREIRRPDDALLAMFAGVGSQIGQFVERNRAEQNLEFVSRLPEENPAPVMRINEGRFLTYANPAGRRMLRTWGQTTGDEVPEEIAQVARRTLVSRERTEIEICFGNTVYSITFVPVAETDYVNLFFNNITERQRAESVTRQLAAIVESTDDAVIGKDLNGIITSWNAAATRLYGYHAEEVIGKSISLLIPADRPDEEPAILEKLRRGESIDHYQTVRVAKDGRRIDVSLTVSPIRDSSGKVIGASKIARDITAQKRAEQDREELLQSEHAARAEAEAANRIKDEFLATLSHELRTPLNAIVGWAGMLRAGKLDEESVKHAIEIINRNAKVQAQLIDDILDVSRIVSGKIRLEVQAVELAQLIEAGVDSIRPAAQAKNIQVRIRVDAKAGLISGDPDRLQQVVWNLLSNAVKFTPSGGKITIRADSTESNLQISVSDTGEGISADFLPHVFERFRQADGSLTRTHKGLGLGLAIVRHLVEMHGGSVKAESKGEGKGATFTVTLPLLTGSIGSSSDQPEETPALPANGFSLDGLRVLLVDDEEDARELHSTLLRELGAEVEVRTSGAEALKVMRKFRPDVLISDLEMPGLDGYSFIRRLRQDESLNGDAQIPALALTAHARAEDRERALRSGFQEHLPKPVEPAELARVLVNLIEQRHSANR
jgi:PAS domain S-box-containing protein